MNQARAKELRRANSEQLDKVQPQPILLDSQGRRISPDGPSEFKLGRTEAGRVVFKFPVPTKTLTLKPDQARKLGRAVIAIAHDCDGKDVKILITWEGDEDK